MSLTFGLLLLIIGFIIFSVGIARLVFSNSPANRNFSIIMVITGFVLLIGGLIMLHLGEGKGLQRVPIGVSIMLVGFVLMLIGGWHGIWGPASRRITKHSMNLLLVGLSLFIIGVIVVAIPSSGSLRNVSFLTFIGKSHRNTDISKIFSHRMGPIPYGTFVIGMLLAVNGLGVRNGMRLRALLGTNFVILAMLIILYALGPNLFSTW